MRESYPHQHLRLLEFTEQLGEVKWFDLENTCCQFEVEICFGNGGDSSQPQCTWAETLEPVSDQGSNFEWRWKVLRQPSGYAVRLEQTFQGFKHIHRVAARVLLKRRGKFS